MTFWLAAQGLVTSVKGGSKSRVGCQGCKAKVDAVGRAGRENEVQRMIARLKNLLRPAPITTAAGLRELIAGESAVIAQKTAMGYCTAKTGSFSYALFQEKPFIDALTICRWESFAAVLSDMLVIAETFLRPHAGDARAEAGRALVAMYASILRSHPEPKHRPQGWAEEIAAFEARFAAAQAGPLVEPAAVATASGRRLYDVLPLHTNYRVDDEQVIVASVTFQMVGVWDTMNRRLDGPAVARDLARSVAGPGT
jgi:hypothetical protein